MQGLREKVIISFIAASEISVTDSESHFEYFTEQVKTDYVDIFIIACCDKISEYDRVTGDNSLLTYARRLQGEKKIGHIGFSTHVSDIACKVIESGNFGLLMYPINPAFDVITNEEKYVSNDIGQLWEAAYEYHSNDKENVKLIRKNVYSECERNQVGLVAMKPFAAGWLFRPDMNTGFTPENLISYVSSQIGVSTVVPGCSNSQEMEEVLSYLTCSNEMLDFSNAISKSRWNLKGHCQYCSHCLPCPVKIDIAQISRLIDSAKDGLFEELSKNYNSLAVKASSCIQCGECEKRCPFNVEVIKKIEAAVNIFK